MTLDRRERRRYRKVSTRVWGDDKFQALSGPDPNAQTLWFYLVFGQHTGVIPGLSVAGEASLAEALRWPLKDFRAKFSEITDQGMAVADWTQRVVWLPNAVYYNEPESPNVAKGWVKSLDEIPDCDLKMMAIGQIRGFLKGMPEGFLEGFEEALRKYRVKTSYMSANFTRGNQEQEQDQEQEQKQREGCLSEGQELADRAAAFIERYEQLYQSHRKGARYLVKPARDFMYSEQLCRTWPDERLDRIAAFFLTTDHQFARNGSRTIGQLTALASWCDDQLTQARAGSRPRSCNHIPQCADDVAHTKRYIAEQRAS